MKKRLIMTILCVGMIATLVTACGSSSKPKESYTSKTTQAYDIEENSEQNTEQQEADRNILPAFCQLDHYIKYLLRDDQSL